LEYQVKTNSGEATMTDAELDELLAAYITEVDDVKAAALLAQLNAEYDKRGLLIKTICPPPVDEELI
jgi:hypothetical protein